MEGALSIEIDESSQTEPIKSLIWQVVSVLPFWGSASLPGR
jgi:hypothetical protein